MTAPHSTNINTDTTTIYHDVAISFAEEQRDLAVAIYTSLEAQHLDCYYYPEVKRNIGRAITEELSMIYGTNSKSAILILSEAYLQKTYARLEAGIIVERRSKQGDAFPVIPVKTDATLPEDIGLPPGTIYIEWKHNPGDIAELVKANIHAEPAKSPTQKRPDKNTFHVQAGSIKNNISAGTVKGDLNIN